MAAGLILNVVLLLYFFSVIAEDFYKPLIPKVKILRKRINEIPSNFTLLVLTVILCINLFLLSKTYNPLNFLLESVFSFMVLMHGLWISAYLSALKTQIVLFTSMIIFLIIMFTNTFTHDLFTFLGILWLGPFLMSFNFFTQKHFLIVSFIWLIYDIFYVWVTSGYSQINGNTNSAGFPLALVIQNQSIGLADLLWTSLFLSAIATTKYKLVGAALLVIVNVLLEVYVFRVKTINFFPLLVLWVPVGSFIIFVEKLSLKRKKISQL